MLSWQEKGGGRSQQNEREREAHTSVGAVCSREKLKWLAPSESSPHSAPLAID